MLQTAMLAAMLSLQSTSTPPSPAASGQSVYRAEQPTVFPGARIEFPKLTNFVKGTPATAFEPGTTYVFDFFTSTCGQCAQAAPMIKEFERTYAARGFRFIGVSYEPATVVSAWLAKPGVGEHALESIVSDPEQAAANALQHPTFQNLAPRLFVVRDGTVLWFGHPDFAEKPLAEIAAGSWNPESVRADCVTNSLVARALEQINSRIAESEKSGNWAPTIELLDAVAIAIPQRGSNFELKKFTTLIGPAKQPDEGYRYGRALAVKYAKDIVSLRSIARATLAAPQVERRDLAFAFAVASAADALGKEQDSKSAEVLALAYFSQGNKPKAIETIERAIRLQTDPKTRKLYESTLRRYRQEDARPMPSGKS